MKPNGLMPDYRHPRSRDWGLPDFPCRRTNCIYNKGNMCILPSQCEIGEDGKCEGYTSEEIR